MELTQEQPLGVIAHHRSERLPVSDTPDVDRLIVLANAELLEVRAADDATRARAAQVVSSALDAMATAREIRKITGPSNT